MTEEKQRECVVELWAVINPQGRLNTYAIAETELLCIEKFLYLHKGFGATWDEWMQHNYTTSKIYVTLSRPYDIDAIKAAERENVYKKLHSALRYGGIFSLGDAIDNLKKSFQPGKLIEDAEIELSCGSQDVELLQKTRYGLRSER